MIDYTTARANMVDSQIRPNKVTDPRIVNAMYDIPRELFVPASMRSLAYMDEEITFPTVGQTSFNRYMMAPMTLARLVHLAAVEAGDMVLDIGCASGYSSVLLARMAGAVVGVESDAALAETASGNIEELEADNAAIVRGDLAQGYPDEGPYDAILLQGSVREIPEILFAQLKVGGRLVAIIGNRDMGQACLYRNIAGEISGISSFDAAAPELPGFEAAPEFVF